MSQYHKNIYYLWIRTDCVQHIKLKVDYAYCICNLLSMKRFREHTKTTDSKQTIRALLFCYMTILNTGHCVTNVVHLLSFVKLSIQVICYCYININDMTKTRNTFTKLASTFTRSLQRTGNFSYVFRRW